MRAIAIDCWLRRFSWSDPRDDFATSYRSVPAALIGYKEAVPPSDRPLPADERPVDPTPVHTADLPPTPTRDRNIPATAWVEAPAALLALGEDIGEPVAMYKRRIGEWLLWRAGPSRGPARYMALHEDDLTDAHSFDLSVAGRTAGRGPDGEEHESFRAWKQSLLGR